MRFSICAASTFFEFKHHIYIDDIWDKLTPLS